jgi:small subunit ribosomal protein S11e
MATELTVQSERAYQKQPHIFLNQKQKAAKSKKTGSGRRWYKDVGLGFRTPKTAISGSYIGQCISRNPGYVEFAGFELAKRIRT